MVVADIKKSDKCQDTRPDPQKDYYFLTDFQTVRTSTGLTHIDFEMNHNHKTLIDSIRNPILRKCQ
jgi:hypothetical protein